jgi:2'-5' RNA ligase
VRWSAVEKLHLTLKFLGDTPAERVDDISRLMGETANRFSPFVIQLGRRGAFPSVQRPQVIWLGVEGGAELERLAEELDAGLSELGFARETRLFRAHLTLGRVRSQQDAEALSRRLREEVPLSATRWSVERIELFRSELRPQGSVYTSLCCHPLSGRGEYIEPTLHTG